PLRPEHRAARAQHLPPVRAAGGCGGRGGPRRTARAGRGIRGDRLPGDAGWLLCALPAWQRGASATDALRDRAWPPWRGTRGDRTMMGDVGMATPAESPPQMAVRPGDERTSQGHQRSFVLQVIQPGLAGLMDGSVSTLAPIFASAFATQNTHTAFLVGLAAAVGAGISMGFSEGLSDDGTLTGRGAPLKRGAITGGMTFVGGIFHTL